MKYYWDTLWWSWDILKSAYTQNMNKKQIHKIEDDSFLKDMIMYRKKLLLYYIFTDVLLCSSKPVWANAYRTKHYTDHILSSCKRGTVMSTNYHPIQLTCFFCQMCYVSYILISYWWYSHPICIVNIQYTLLSPIYTIYYIVTWYILMHMSQSDSSFSQVWNMDRYCCWHKCAYFHKYNNI